MHESITERKREIGFWAEICLKFNNLRQQSLFLKPLLERTFHWNKDVCLFQRKKISGNSANIVMVSFIKHPKDAPLAFKLTRHLMTARLAWFSLFMTANFLIAVSLRHTHNIMRLHCEKVAVSYEDIRKPTHCPIGKSITRICFIHLYYAKRLCKYSSDRFLSMLFCSGYSTLSHFYRSFAFIASHLSSACLFFPLLSVLWDLSTYPFNNAFSLPMANNIESNIPDEQK